MQHSRRTPHRSLLFALLMTGATAAIPAQAQRASTDLTQIRAYPCTSASRTTRPATSVNFNGHAYLLTTAGHPGEGETIPVCSTLTQGALKLVARDDLYNLSVFELPDGTPGLKLSALWGRDEPSVGAQTVKISTAKSERHTFGAGIPMFEVLTPRQSTLEFLRNGGAPLTSGAELIGILSDQSVVILPGQPAKSFRERDLRLLAQLPFASYRLAFTSGFLTRFLQSVTAPGYVPELLLTSETTASDSASVTRWTVRGPRPLEVEEKCLNASALANDRGNYPVGGVEPFGVGGLEDVLSTCQIRELTANGARRIALAYRRDEHGTLVSRSLWNVQSLNDDLHQSGWKFLVENPPSDAGQGAALLKLADELRSQTIAFYQTQGGNPLVLRQLFLVSSLLISPEWRTVTAKDLATSREAVENELPLYLGMETDRISAADSDFARAKTELGRKLGETIAAFGAVVP